MNDHNSHIPETDERIIKNLRYCAHFLRHHTEERGSQRRVLHLLGHHGSMTQRDLLDQLGVRASSLSELLSKLETKGFITKEKSEADKRNFDVALTESGQQALREMQEQYNVVMADLLSGFDAEESAQLDDLLQKLHDLWQKRAESEPAASDCCKHNGQEHFCHRKDVENFE